VGTAASRRWRATSRGRAAVRAEHEKEGALVSTKQQPKKALTLYGGRELEIESQR
jgi:hypothetical protein